MKPEEIFTEEEYKVFLKLYETELTRNEHPSIAFKSYHVILRFLDKGAWLTVGEIPLYKPIKFKKFKRFKNTLLRAVYDSGSIIFSLEKIK